MLLAENSWFCFMRATTTFLLNECLEALQCSENGSNRRLMEEFETQGTEDSAFDLSSQSRILAEREKVVVIESVNQQNDSLNIIDGQFSIHARLDSELKGSLLEKEKFTSLSRLRGSVVRLDRYVFLTTYQCNKLLNNRSTGSGNCICLWIEKMTVVETSGLVVDPLSNVTQHSVVQSRINELFESGQLMQTLVKSQILDDRYLFHDQDHQPQEAECIIPEDQEAKLQGQEGWDTQAPKITDSELIAENEPIVSGASAVGALTSQDFYFEQEDINCNFIPCGDVDSDAALQALSDQTEEKFEKIDVIEMSEVSMDPSIPVATSGLYNDFVGENDGQSKKMESSLEGRIDEATLNKISSIDIMSVEAVPIDRDESDQVVDVSNETLLNTSESKERLQTSHECDEGQWYPDDQIPDDTILSSNEKIPVNLSPVREKSIHHELKPTIRVTNTSPFEETPKRLSKNSRKTGIRTEDTSAIKAIPSPQRTTQETKHCHTDRSQNEKSKRRKEKVAFPRTTTRLVGKSRLRPMTKTKKAEEDVPFDSECTPSLDYRKRLSFFSSKNGHIRPSKRYKHLFPPFNIEALKGMLARPVP